MNLVSATDVLLREFRAQPTMRAGSLIVTVFGDAIAPRGGTVWLGSLIRVMADFGISERLVRTSIFRLSQDDWFVVEQAGRRSYYSLSSEGAQKFGQATHRIYGEPRQVWSGDWCLILLPDLEATLKERVRKELSWLGFATVSAGVLAHPSPEMTDLGAMLNRTGCENDLVVMRARTNRNGQEKALRRLVHKHWRLADIDARYAAFVRMFRPVLSASTRKNHKDPRIAFLVRMLLIQEYRKVLLRDPLLPAELLPPKWHGTAAYQLCRNLYLSVFEAADDYMTQAMETADGPLPPPAPEFFTRFGGLRKAEKKK
ncbi:MAG TPA: phenylacetic acid degradation operon negative regulatory protein PaaX [Woeseiaceae bacterium]|jgi:phenylacetic acid degradation operon negative regulatory protein